MTHTEETDMQSKAIVFESPNQVGLRHFELREPAAGELLVQTSYSCISPGTEMRCLRGEEQGAGPFPLIPGYAMVGRVLRGGEGTKLSEGTPVYCMGTICSGPFGSYSSGHLGCGIVPEAWATPVPEGLAMRDAAIAVLGAIALHGRNLVPDIAGKRVLVVGLGVIGQLSARLFTLGGAQVTACDLSAERVAMASRPNLRATCPDGDTLLVEDGAQIVVDCTGSPSVLAWSLKQTHVPPWQPDGKYAEPIWCVVQGSYPAGVNVHAPSAFMRELRILFSRATCYSDIAETMRLIRDGELECGDLISLEARPEDAPEVYARLASGDTSMMTAAFNWTTE